MSQGGFSADQRISSYMTLRKAIGLIGILLPFVLASVNMLLVSDIILQGSVSGYYYTGARDVLVGGLCAIGVFLITYSGHDDWDKWFTNAAGVFAIAVALFPTAPVNPSATAKAIGYVHFTFAALLFLTLAAIALWLFRKTEQGVERKKEKKRRDLVYPVCGIVIVLCVALVPIESFVIGAAITKYKPLFWLEAVAVFAFGFAWLVKGQAILKDKPPQPLAGADPEAGLAEELIG